jgi:hypothetical protein
MAVPLHHCLLPLLPAAGSESAARTSSSVSMDEPSPPRARPRVAREQAEPEQRERLIGPVNLSKMITAVVDWFAANDLAAFFEGAGAVESWLKFESSEAIQLTGQLAGRNSTVLNDRTCTLGYVIIDSTPARSVWDHKPPVQRSCWTTSSRAMKAALLRRSRTS